MVRMTIEVEKNNLKASESISAGHLLSMSKYCLFYILFKLC